MAVVSRRRQAALSEGDRYFALNRIIGLVVKFIQEHDDLRDLSLVDSVMLMLQKDAPRHWLLAFCAALNQPPNL